MIRKLLLIFAFSNIILILSTPRRLTWPSAILTIFLSVSLSDFQFLRKPL